MDVDPEFDEMAVPDDVINKRATIEASKEEAAGQVKNFRLTKHLKQMIQYKPAYTSGAFYVLAGNQYALSLNDSKVTLMEISTN